ncbi:unnamed protein product [Orchesella dallaii]|uniref:Peptidase M48 domain-containing protein n=1 Tax=Orchesella dallaii TaxID=48710 RepID=A0ABP1QZU3_9HEXA
MLTLLLHFHLRLTTLGIILLATPMKLYLHFILEENHGFNNKNIFSSTTSFILSFLSTSLPWIGFFYDNRTRLKEGPLRSRLEALATRCEFPPYSVLVREKSHRTYHSNAFCLSILCFNRIYLDDTLIKGYVSYSFEGDDEKGLNDEEVEAVLAHEIGHSRLMHFEKNLAIHLSIQFAVGCLFQYLKRYTDGTAAGSLIMEISKLLAIIIVNGYLGQVLHRFFVYQADAYATELGYGEQLKKGLMKLNKDNLTLPFADSLYSAVHNSRPTTFHRLAAIDDLMAKMN